MKKEYETPEMEVIELGNEDVVITSDCDSYCEIVGPEICVKD